MENLLQDIRYSLRMMKVKPSFTLLTILNTMGVKMGAAVQNLFTSAKVLALAAVVLVGMRMPPNYGPTYVARFDGTFAEVSKARKTALVPFFFDGFISDDAMFQADRVHPVAGAQPKLLDNVWPALKPLLDATGKPG